MNHPYILMIENDEDDQYITRQYFAEYQVDAVILNEGSEALPYLQECINKQRSLPSLILLDYHLSPLNAVDIIKLIRWFPAFAPIPVVVLSGTKSDEIVRACYSSGANSFIQKPFSEHDIKRKISSFITYWLETVELST